MRSAVMVSLMLCPDTFLNRELRYAGLMLACRAISFQAQGVGFKVFPDISKSHGIYLIVIVL